MYKLLIVDDEPLVQVGIRSMVHWEELDIEICGVANNGQIAFDMLESLQPDIVITDIKMPIMSGLELIKKSREKYGNIKPAFIVLTSYEDFQLAKEAISYQIVEYLVKIELTAGNLTGAVEKALGTLAKEERVNGLTGSDIQALRDKFFIRLLHNLFDSEEQFHLLRRDLGIPFTYDTYQCCYFEMVNDKASDLSLEGQVTLYANSYHLLQEITEKYQHAYFATLDRKHGVIILLYDDEKNVHNYEDLRQILDHIGDTLYHYYSTSIRCGIGNTVKLPLEISDSYMSARANYRQLFESHDTASRHAIFNISIFKDDLSKAFSEYDSELLSNVMTQIISLFEEHPDNYIQALDAACNVLFLGISLLPGGEEVTQSVFEDMPDGYRSIYNQKTTPQVTSWMHTYMERMCQMFTEHKKEHRHHVVDNVKKYIETHLNDKLSLNEVSAIYGISPNYLSALFKKYNDCGYSEYITERKICEAKKMMARGDMKVYEIADALGFESAFYFSKVFKKVEGMSPMEYINR